mmetsp:Transcript_28889/g.49195  ORF Transcript_28889/g.49195 Transcript_28889/m.49195 type:complete len:143 (-) Transcript_28889:1159-1587(-)
MYIHTQIIRHTTVIMMKKPDQVMAVATERNEEANIVAVARFAKVARLIAFARIDVVKTSDAIVHVAGPIPILKNARYNANPTIAPTSLGRAPMKLMATMKNDTAQPNKETKTKGLRPVLSSKRPAIKMTPNLTSPKPSNIHI